MEKGKRGKREKGKKVGVQLTEFFVSGTSAGYPCRDGRGDTSHVDAASKPFAFRLSETIRIRSRWEAHGEEASFAQ